MARQKGIIQLTGKLGEYSFYKSQDGFLVKAKGGPDREKVLHHLSFERTRENGSEFGMCTKAGSLLRKATAPLNRASSDNRLTSRLNQLMFRIKELDTMNPRGQRNVTQGLVSVAGKNLLKEFEFNNRSRLRDILSADYTVDANTGMVNFSSINPVTDIKFPEGATHANITAVRTRINFMNGDKENTFSTALSIARNQVAGPVSLGPLILTQNGTDIFALQIVFMQEISGVMYSLKDGGHNCMRIIEVV